ncbi:MAG: hypothetical protein SOW59_05845 [Corynebacterium sp.]|nr:hypothetical protein [Corynebacterium sp.]
MHLLVWIMFLIAGLFVGGAWAAYQHKSRLWTFIAGCLAVAATAMALVWMIGEMR